MQHESKESGTTISEKEESHIKEHFTLSGGLNWIVKNFNNKPPPLCIIDRNRLPKKLLKALDKEKVYKLMEEGPRFSGDREEGR